MTLDWLVYVLGVVAVVFLVGMFFKYKKHNRYADKFEDTYPDAKWDHKIIIFQDYKIIQVQVVQTFNENRILWLYITL